ncbi:PREDICTED: olfactory receptor 7E24-like [Myotis davidii]|uniref:olfactory receptor 7E24-like n=1 Tax=Myotis davidii TaxID=225400 RepID=UPI0003EC23DF|nr:PREDICTED: olfactory receptor 7E24-like [Myotis davidii]
MSKEVIWSSSVTICELLESKIWVPLHLFHLFSTLFFFKMCPICIEPQNGTADSEFLLLGLSGRPELQPLLFGLFLSMYLVTMLGNLLMILAVISDSHLHTPMYFFLSNLSLADISFSTTTVPKMLVNLQTHSKSITYAGCLTQVTFFSLFACLESLLLAVLAYDRLVAICQPLHYLVIMSPRLCGLLVLLSYFFSLLDSQLHYLMVSQLNFCTDVEIHHFFCDPVIFPKEGCGGLSDVYCGHPHAEPLHLQPEEQGHQECPMEDDQKNSLISLPVLSFLVHRLQRAVKSNMCNKKF